MEYQAVRVKTVSSADGATCRDCGETFGKYWNMNVPWNWRKSQALHEHGMNHKMDLFKVTEVRAA